MMAGSVAAIWQPRGNSHEQEGQQAEDAGEKEKFWYLMAVSDFLLCETNTLYV